MFLFTIRMRDETRWRANAKTVKAAMNEIAHAQCTGSVGSTNILDDTHCGGSVRLIAEVHNIDENGNDVLPS